MENVQLYEPEKIDLIKWQGYSIEAEKLAQAIVVTDDDEEAMAIDTVSRIKKFSKETEDARTEKVDPFNLFVKRVNNMFKPITVSLEKAEAMIKTKILAYQREKEVARQKAEAEKRKQYEEELRKAEEEAKKNGTGEIKTVSIPVVTLPDENTKRGSVGAASKSKTWKAEITDLPAFLRAVADGKAPADSVEVKIGVLNRLAAINKRDGVVPGVRFFEEEGLRIR